MARDSAALVARNGVPIGDAEAIAQALLDAEIDLADPRDPDHVRRRARDGAGHRPRARAAQGHVGRRRHRRRGAAGGVPAVNRSQRDPRRGRCARRWCSSLRRSSGWRCSSSRSAGRSRAGRRRRPQPSRLRRRRRSNVRPPTPAPPRSAWSTRCSPTPTRAAPATSWSTPPTSAPGGSVSVTVTCFASDRGVEVVQDGAREFSTTATARIDRFRAAEEP